MLLLRQVETKNTTFEKSDVVLENPGGMPLKITIKGQLISNPMNIPFIYHWYSLTISIPFISGTYDTLYGGFTPNRATPIAG